MKTAFKNGIPFAVLSGVANVRESNPRELELRATGSAGS
jgi:hypothetical protein